METLGARLEPVAPRLAGSTAGRAVLYATVVHRPSRMSPEQALGDMRAFMAASPALNAILAEASPFEGQIPPACPSRSPGAATTGCCRAVRRWWPGPACRRPGSCGWPGCGHAPMTDDPALVAGILLRGSSRPLRPEVSEPTRRPDVAPSP